MFFCGHDARRRSDGRRERRLRHVHDEQRLPGETGCIKRLQSNLEFCHSLIYCTMYYNRCKSTFIVLHNLNERDKKIVVSFSLH